MMISRAGRGSVERRDECDEEAIPWRRYAVVDGGPARPSFFPCSRARSYVKPPRPPSDLVPLALVSNVRAPVYGYIDVP